MAAAMATEGSIASIFIVQVGKAPVARLRILAMVSSFLSGMRPSLAAWPWAISFVVACRMASGSFVCHHLPHGLGQFRLSSPAAWLWAVSFVITCRMVLGSFVCHHLPYGLGQFRLSLSAAWLRKFCLPCLPHGLGQFLPQFDIVCAEAHIGYELLAVR